MSSAIELVLAMIGMSAVVTYLCWLRFRIWAFRQDLFSIRDRLWGEMLASGMLNDPAHRELRDGINALIRIAPLLSLITMLHILLKRQDIQAVISPQDRPAAVTMARMFVLGRTAQYLIGETLSGWVLICGFTLLGLAGDLKRFLGEKIGWLLDVHAIQDMSLRLPRKPVTDLVEV